MNIDYIKLAQGRYEEELLSMDFSNEGNVPDFAYNVLNPLGLLYRPLADEHFLDNGGGKPNWPEGKPMAVCLTHDVDHVSSYSLKQSLRIRRLHILNTSNTYRRIRIRLGVIKDLAGVRNYCLKEDPLYYYERWLDLEEEFGVRSTFFFWPGWSNITKHHHTDCLYDLTDCIVFNKEKCTVAEMIGEMERRGWEIGLHPSWYTFNDLDELKRQKEALEGVLGHDIVSVRQHYLHYDIRVTPRIHADAGLKYDSTLGFNDNVGFRFGTCYPWNIYNLQTEKALPILEIPLIIQDGAMLNPNKGMRLDKETAFKYVKQITDSVEKVGGVLTLLWHPVSFIEPDSWALFLNVLEHLEKRNPWFATVKEIGEWWENRTII